ncbi:MAG: NAD-dependent epimerase/dehydratase family protein [Lachnospiraceae bacterium]|nr:NAD-dependent epimerase/dehydratase family protein [Lachnospiraceae bacterium]
MTLHSSALYCADLSELIRHIPGKEALFGKRILITGATGTIGSCIADALLVMNRDLHAGIRVLLAGRNPEKLQQLFGSFAGQEGLLQTLPYDLQEEITWNEDVDYIIHAAGNAHPAAFNTDPVGTITGNVMSTCRLLSYAAEHGAGRLVYVSSGEVYGMGDLSIEELPEQYMGPLDLSSPRSCYPESKRASENLCASWYHQYGLETISVRPCHTYGPMITPSDNRANAQFFKTAASGHDIVLNSAGTQMRSYNYVCDAASAILTVLASGQAGEAYNIANPASRVTIAGLAEEIAAAAGVRRVFVDPDSVALANRSPIARQVLSTARLEALGWTGAFTLTEGVTHTLQILQEIQK